MATVPTSPQITVRPVATSGALRFYWAAPVSDGGSAITGYTLSCAGETPQSLGASTYDYTYTGLTNGTSYTFSITAENAVGSSTAATFRTVKPGNKPGPVQNLTVTRTDATTATLNWTAPSSDGGAALIGYFVQATSTDKADPVIKQSAAGTSATVRSLVAGAVYTFTVQAVNDPGYGPAVASNPTSMTSTWYQSQLASEWNNWSDIACDISGMKLLAATGWSPTLSQPLFQSLDRGVTWKQLPSAGLRTWIWTASSADGTKLVAAVRSGTSGGGSLYTSSDSGATWVERTAAGSRAWHAISCSSNASVILAGDYNSPQVPYLSRNGGASWSTPTLPVTDYWGSTYCSANGQVLAVGGESASGLFVISIDGGSSWTNRTSQLGLTSSIWGIAASSDSTKMVVIGSTGVIRRSIDTGASWTTVLSGLGTVIGGVIQGVCSIASSADGTKLFACFNATIWVSVDSGTSWRRAVSYPMRGTTAATGYFYRITCSANGQVAYASQTNNQIWCSQDAGYSWFRVSSPGQNQGYASCMSSDGATQYTAEFNVPSGYLLKSTNKGVSWSRTGLASTEGTKAWRWLCCSADGTNIAATETSLASTASGYIWTSTDSGATLTRQDAAGARNWRGICCDISGTKLAACVATASTGNIYTADLSGSDFIWTARTGAGGRTWRGIACSADRTKIVACVNAASSSIYTSADSGVNWTVQTGAGSRNWLNVTCTPDFTKMLASITTGGVYMSTDSGVTWTAVSGLPSTTAYNFNGLAISSDGTKMAAGDLNFGVWLSTDSGATWTQQTKVQNNSIFSISMNPSGSIITAPSYFGLGPLTYQLFG